MILSSWLEFTDLNSFYRKGLLRAHLCLGQSKKSWNEEWELKLEPRLRLGWGWIALSGAVDASNMIQTVWILMFARHSSLCQKVSDTLLMASPFVLLFFLFEEPLWLCYQRRFHIKKCAIRSNFCFISAWLVYHNVCNLLSNVSSLYSGASWNCSKYFRDFVNWYCCVVNKQICLQGDPV